MSDNGSINEQDKPVEKTQDELDKERMGRFIKEPHSFIEISELICAVVRNSKSQLGISVLVGNCKRSELNQAEAEIIHILRKTRISMDIESEIKHQAIKNLIVPKHSMIDGARKIFGRK